MRKVISLFPFSSLVEGHRRSEREFNQLPHVTCETSRIPNHAIQEKGASVRKPEWKKGSSRLEREDSLIWKKGRIKGVAWWGRRWNRAKRLKEMLVDDTTKNEADFFFYSRKEWKEPACNLYANQATSGEVYRFQICHLIWKQLGVNDMCSHDRRTKTWDGSCFS